MRPPAPPPRPHYRFFPITDLASIAALHRAVGDSGFATLLKLNRIDLDHIRSGDSLVVADSASSLFTLSPFPDSLPAARAVGKLLLVSARVQAFGAFEDGRLLRWGPVSSGRKEKPTPPGLYHANWKGRVHVSTIDEAWILNWYVNLGNFDGISLHQYELPGRPASHSCVRLLEDDAEWIYGWVGTWKVAKDRRHIVEPGTPVVVIGEYGWGKRRPWKRLVDDSTATDVSAEEIYGALRQFGVRGIADSAAVAAADSASLVPRFVSGEDSVRMHRGATRKDSAGVRGAAAGRDSARVR